MRTLSNVKGEPKRKLLLYILRISAGLLEMCLVMNGFKSMDHSKDFLVYLYFTRRSLYRVG